MKTGDMVYYKRQHPGGYGYEGKYPAMVVKLNKSSVRIRLARVNTDEHKQETFERNVDISRLSARKKDHGFDDVLLAGR